MRMREVVRRLLHVDVLEEFRGATNGGAPNLASWDRLLDTDLGDPGTDHRTLKDVLEERMIRPFLKMDERCNLPKFGAAYSSILFGPPGTAKSTICEALAQRLGWDFVVIDTATFLADGLTNVASRIRYVFARLQCLTDTVILFDEIEEFCLDRESPGLGMESRMLTTAMLTAINDLRKGKRSIFFLATNRLRAFDSAIIRPGRFDMQLFVGTPNLEARVILFRDQLASVPVDTDIKDAAEDTFRSYIQSVWNENIMFFNYLEALQFASQCADVIARGNELTEDAMAAILKSQAVVMTVRGAVREEYVASMGLSRL
jgi:SpoVK/Ycf46/Vps4 family AAA+-type ATPase